MKKPYKCGECPKRFQKKEYLKQHLRFVHSEDKPFQCQFCEFRSKYKGHVKNHLKTHFPETVVRPFTCSECNWKCKRQDDLKTHLLTHTGEKPFACGLCSYRANSRSDVTRHAIKHTIEKPFSCSQCDFACSLAENLRRHVRHIHTYKGDRPFSCSFPGCDRKFSVNSSLKLHLLSVHAKKTRFKCPSCPKEYYTKDTCEVHIRRHHTKEKLFKCKSCDYAAVTASEVNQHSASQHEAFLGLECPVCHKGYKNKRSLGKHRTRAHRFQPGEKPFECQFCDYSSATSVSLTEHTRTHTGEKPYKCDWCQRSFTRRGVLAAHKAIAHSNSRPFKCDVYDSSFKTKFSLKEHRANHYPVPALYECAICKKSGGTLLGRNQRSPKFGGKWAFTKKSSFKYHMKRHSDERTYKCHLCDHVAKLPSCLRAHLLKVHKMIGQQSPSERRTNGFESDKLSQMHAATSNITVEESPGTSADNVKKCRPCFVRLVRLKPSEVIRTIS